MAITVIDGTKSSAKAVRTLLYDQASELSGATLATDNAGTIVCEYGTLAYKAATPHAPKILDHDGTWKDA